MRRWIALAVSALVTVGIAVVAPASVATAMATPPAPTSSRLTGDDRYAVAINVSKAGFPGTAPIVFLATGENYPDALAAGPVAAKLHGPLLLTPTAALTPAVSAEITRLHPATIDIVGGPASVSPAVQTALTNLSWHPTVNRFGGDDRYAVARTLISTFWTSAPKMFVATGANFPDALSAAAAAGNAGAPVLLVYGAATGLDTPTTQLLTSESTTSALIAGGTGTVSPGIETALDTKLGASHVQRAAGADRYAASEEVARLSFGSATTAYIATGTNFPDALAASALAGAEHAPLVTVPGTCVPTPTIDELEKLGITTFTVVGGPASVTDAAAILSPCTAPAESVHWLSQSILNGSHGNFWLGLSCPQTGYCIGVGSPGIIDIRNGTGWSTQVSPTPFGASGSVNSPEAVSCATIFYCMITGSYSNSGTNFSELVLFKNGVFTATTPNGPVDTGGTSQSMDLDAVSCPDDGDCVAVGKYEDTAVHQSAFSAIVSGATESDVKIPVPAGAATDPKALEAAVDCPVAGTCYAIGSYLDGSAHRRTMISTLSSGAWTTTAVALPSDAAADPAVLPQKLECRAVGVCLALADYNATGGGAGTALIGLTSGTWTAVEPSVPSNATAVSAADLSCAFNAGCIVAETATIGGVDRVITQAFDDDGWEGRTTMPVPAGVTGDLTANSIGCFVSGCTVFGTTKKTASTYQAFQVTLSISGSTATLLGNGGQTTANNVSIAACSWAGDCTGLGDNVNVV